MKTNRVIQVFLLVVFGIMAVVACRKEPTPVPGPDIEPETQKAAVISGEASHVSCMAAQISGQLVIPESQIEIREYGIMYSTSNDLAVHSDTTVVAVSYDADNIFNITTGKLEPETEYYYRSYMAQSDTTLYGEVKSFKTLAVSSMISTESVTEVGVRGAVITAKLNLTDCIYDSVQYGIVLSENGGAFSDIECDNLTEGKFSHKFSSLKFNTKYMYAPYVVVDGRMYEYMTAVFNTLPVPDDAVDLGLSVLWSSCNLGASQPEEYGGYYQWAGLEDISDLSINAVASNCPYHDSQIYNAGWTAYNTYKSYGTVDNKLTLDSSDDAASVALGGGWRMATSDEWKELCDNCTATWTEMLGVKGYKLTSNVEGFTDKYIFLPAAGYRKDNQIVDKVYRGSYSSSSLASNAPSFALGVCFCVTNDAPAPTELKRWFGHSVRPVI